MSSYPIAAKTRDSKSKKALVMSVFKVDLYSTFLSCFVFNFYICMSLFIKASNLSLESPNLLYLGKPIFNLAFQVYWFDSAMLHAWQLEPKNKRSNCSVRIFPIPKLIEILILF